MYVHLIPKYRITTRAAQGFGVTLTAGKLGADDAAEPTSKITVELKRDLGCGRPSPGCTRPGR